MKLLLDTHALVWAASDPDRLSDAARTAIADPSNQLLVSAASAWEMSTKVRSGRFPEAEPLVAQFDDVTATLGATPLPMTAAHALRSSGLDWEHRDPFDRMLAAQALLEHAVLVTRDSTFPTLGGLQLLW